jgi:hypothetical protein
VQLAAPAAAEAARREPAGQALTRARLEAERNQRRLLLEQLERRSTVLAPVAGQVCSITLPERGGRREAVVVLSVEVERGAGGDLVL